MKKTRKLIPALAMLLISAVMMSTASFAWFSMSTTVDATGMQVQATASRNLMISKTEDSGYGAGVDFGTSLDEMVPCSTNGANNPTLYKLDGGNIDATMSQDDYSSKDSKFTAATANVDYLKQTAYIKCVGGDATNLTASIVANSATNALDPSLRVMLVVNGTAFFIYTPVSGAEYGTSGKAVSELDGDNKKVLGDLPTISDDATVILGSLVSDTAYEVDIYIWYEGEDKSCTATNALDLVATSFAINFSVI